MNECKGQECPRSLLSAEARGVVFLPSFTLGREIQYPLGGANDHGDFVTAEVRVEIRALVCLRRMQIHRFSVEDRESKVGVVFRIVTCDFEVIPGRFNLIVHFVGGDF